MIDVACTYILAVAGLYTTRSQVGGQAKLKIKKSKGRGRFSICHFKKSACDGSWDVRLRILTGRGWKKIPECGEANAKKAKDAGT